MSLEEALRLVNMTLVLAAAASMWLRLSSLWPHLGGELATVIGRRVPIGVLLVFAGVAIGSATALVRHAPLTLGTPLITVGASLVLSGHWHTRRHHS